MHVSPRNKPCHKIQDIWFFGINGNKAADQLCNNRAADHNPSFSSGCTTRFESRNNVVTQPSQSMPFQCAKIKSFFFAL